MSARRHQLLTRFCVAAAVLCFLLAFLLPDFHWHSVTSGGPDYRPQHGPVVTFTLIDELRAWHDRPSGGFPALDFAARPGLALAAVATVLAALRLRRLAVAAAAIAAICWVVRWLLCANHGFGAGYYSFVLALAALSTVAVLTRRPIGRRGQITGWIAGGALATILLAVLIAQPLVTGAANPSVYPPQATSPYRLPFRGGLTRWCCQGNNGIVSHHGWQRYAYDFTMPVGSDVIAARGGVTNDGHGNWNNEIGVRHDDGTVANYLHLIRGGSYVRVGQRVEQGDLLGASGDVGVSAAPHLHFIVFGPAGKGGRVGLPVSFADVPGDGIPRECRRYTSGNRAATTWAEETRVANP
jgi:hypothetical protein